MSHANAALTPTRPTAAGPAGRRGRLDLRRRRPRCSWSRRGRPKKWAARYRAEGAGRDGRPQLAAAPMPDQDPTRVVRRIVRLRWRHRLGPGADRRPARHAGLDGARGAGPVPDQPALPHRPGHRRTAAPLRARPSRLADPRRRHQVRQHPRRRRHGVTSAGSKATATGQPPLTEPAHRGKRHRGPRIGTAFLHTVIDDHSRVAYAEICTRREGRHRHRRPAAGRRLVRRTRRHRRTGAVRQRLRLPLPRLARRLRRTRHHPQTHPPLPAPDQRQDRTLPPHPGRRLGLRPVLRLKPTSATPPCRAGCTSTITTEPTPPSEANHRSAD